MRRLALSFVLLVCAASARAAEPDYRPDNEGWNGLSELFMLARVAGVRPEVHSTIDWGELGPDDGLAILYPRSAPDLGRLRAFVARGGRVLLADDFGAAEPTFAGLGLSRGEPPPGERFQDRPALPLARAENHVLTQGVQKVVANHATAFLRRVGQPVLSFSADTALCVELSVGRGRLVALSDPSVLINNMLELPGNRAFAFNLIGFLARSGGRLVVVTQEFGQRGQPRSSAAVSSRADALSDFNDFLKDLGSWVPSEGVLRALGLLAAAVACGLIWFGLPRVRPGTSRWARPFEPSALPEGPGALGALLREDVDQRLPALLGLSESPFALSVDELLARAQVRPGQVFAHRLRRLLKKLAQPHRSLRKTRALARQADALCAHLERPS
ncbi:MAG TPA: DUF4350 domain-containing protein [Polyangia bacterium]|nr:DUF4350 domain-containing protein [Polyangia bacterium]